MVGQRRARSGLERRGQWRSEASNSSLWTHVFDNGGDGYGSRLVTFSSVLEAVDEGVLSGEARARGVVSGRLARERALVLSGNYGEDTGAGHTGSSLCISCRG